MTLDHLGHLRANAARFREVLAATDPDARVPSCPDWSADDLLWHLADVHWFWASIVEERRQDPDVPDRPERPVERDALFAFAEEQAVRLHDVLAAADPATAVYMWSEDRTVGYVRRRQAHEALIHRLDAELTGGAVTPLDRDLASDGVLEVFEHMYGGLPPWGAFTPSGDVVQVRVDDTGLVVPVVLGRFTGTDPDSGTAYDEGVAEVASGPVGEPGLVVAGAAEDLDAWLWHRRDAERIRFDGDPGLRARLQDVLDHPLT